MRYNVGDQVVVQTATFILENNKLGGGCYTHIGGSEDTLGFISGMFEYCGEQATVINVTMDPTKQYPRYELDISNDVGWIWCKEMFRKPGANYEKLKIQQQFTNENKFTTELL